MLRIRTRPMFYTLIVLCSSVAAFEFNSFQDLRLAVKNDNDHKFESIPYQEQDKYTVSGSSINVAVRLIIADTIQASTAEGLEITAHLQAVWNDTRLTFNASSPSNNYTLSSSLIDKIWKPAVYMEPEWGSQNEDTRVIRIFPMGVLVASRRIQTRIPCEVVAYGLLDFLLQCSSKLTSYAHGIDEINLYWFNQEPIRLTEDAIQAKEGKINDVVPGACNWSVFPELQSPCLEITADVTITFEWVFVRMYVPSFMAVMMAWSSFWIHRDEVSARIKLGTLVVWTMVTEFITIGFSYPEYLTTPVGNVWMIGCLSFTWLSFFMYIVVHVVRRREKARVKQELEIQYKKKEEEKRTGERALSITSLHPDGIAENKTIGYSIWDKKVLTKWRIEMTSYKVDRLCRIWFGIAFAAFNITFWVYFRVRTNISY